MSNVDFLPNDYRRQAADRRWQIWLAILLAIHGVVIGVVTVLQHREQRSIERRHALVRIPYEKAQAANKRLAELKGQLTEANDVAEFYTYLRHPWPRTTILTALIQKLPSEVSLSEVTVQREQPEDDLDEKRGRPQSLIVSKNEESESKPPSLRQALERLRGEIDRARTIVRVRGIATDTPSLHRSIADLNNSRLFVKVALESMDSMQDLLTPGATTFEILLELLPGYGQPNGPEGSPAQSVASQT
jgi:hypothetical protein